MLAGLAGGVAGGVTGVGGVVVIERTCQTDNMHRLLIVTDGVGRQQSCDTQQNCLDWR